LTEKSNDSLNFSPAERIAAARYLWSHQEARSNQLPPPGDWRVWLIQSGRGWGKTRTGAEWLLYEALKHDGTRWAIVAPTFSDARDTCAEGDSGIVEIARRYGVLKTWNRSLGEIRLTNGSRIKLFGAEEPNRLRGPQFHGAWCDELSSWRYADTWDQLQFGLRLGRSSGIVPRTVVTTTPKPTRLFRSLLERDDVAIVRGSMKDNAANLADEFVKGIVNKYGGTRLGRQEIEGELLLDTPGALWTFDMIDEARVDEAPDMARIVVAVDPATTSTEDADETGIVVVGLGVDGRGYVLADRTCRLSPNGWALRVVEAYDEFHADRIVGETNQGGDMIETILRQVRPTIPYRGIHARKGKTPRAEPISALYEQRRVSHVGHFAELEGQMTGWVDGESDFSPDRIDALVHGLTSLGIGSGAGAADRFFESLAPECDQCGTRNDFDASSCSSCGHVFVVASPMAGFPQLS
jgi:phage terminase large subunit-like protein